MSKPSRHDSPPPDQLLFAGFNYLFLEFTFQQRNSSHHNQPEESMSAKGLGNTTVSQIAIVVRDIDEARQRWAQILGQPIPDIIVTQPGNEVHMTYRGQPSNAQAKLAFFNLGQVQMELIEPIGGPSTWKEALDKRGESVHHIAFWTEDMQASAEFLKEHGIPLVQRGDMGEGQYAYFDAEQQLGVQIELLERVRKARVE
jgi:catechol 2,3-dioxygenase-like lactoylglutathione lyase family enzyme